MAKQAYQLTPADAAKGGRASAALQRKELNLRRNEQRLAAAQQAQQVIIEMLKSPVISGVIAYGLVIGADVAGVFQKEPAVKLSNDLLDTIFNDIFGVGITGLASAAEVNILKASIVTYIMSGGNLAGLLNSAGGLAGIGKAMSGVAAALA